MSGMGMGWGSRRELRGGTKPQLNQRSGKSVTLMQRMSMVLGGFSYIQ